ncbi:MAG: hypothetical protein JNN15_16570 [Blastocatellia bacterium]|nr:hypothetical protein [Blastocatellia bacterium]
MKKSFLFFLLSIFICSFPAIAQEKVSAFEVYAKWRRELRSQNNGQVNPHYSVASVTQRLDSESARVDFAVVGKLSSYTLEVQPIKVDGNTKENAGEFSTSSMEGNSNVTELGYVSETELLIPVSNSANAVEVKWTPRDAIDGMSFTMLLPLEKNPSENVVAFMLPQSESAISNNWLQYTRQEVLYCKNKQ